MSTNGKSYAKETVRRNTGREVDELLRDLYVTRRLSQQEIAGAIGVSRSLVKVWLREYGISRDDRPSASELVA